MLPVGSTSPAPWVNSPAGGGHTCALYSARVAVDSLEAATRVHRPHPSSHCRQPTALVTAQVMAWDFETTPEYRKKSPTAGSKRSSSGLHRDPPDGSRPGFLRAEK